MRTQQRDQTGLVIFSGKFNGAGNLGSAGIGSVTCQFTRSAVGQYKVYFDNSLMPLSVVSSSDAGMALPYAYIPGGISINALSGSGALNDANITFTITARKMGA